MTWRTICVAAVICTAVMLIWGCEEDVSSLGGTVVSAVQVWIATAD